MSYRLYILDLYLLFNRFFLKVQIKTFIMLSNIYSKAKCKESHIKYVYIHDKYGQ